MRLWMRTKYNKYTAKILEEVVKDDTYNASRLGTCGSIRGGCFGSLGIYLMDIVPNGEGHLAMKERKL